MELKIAWRRSLSVLIIRLKSKRQWTQKQGKRAKGRTRLGFKVRNLTWIPAECSRSAVFDCFFWVVWWNCAVTSCSFGKFILVSPNRTDSLKFECFWFVLHIFYIRWDIHLPPLSLYLFAVVTVTSQRSSPTCTTPDSTACPRAILAPTSASPPHTQVRHA